MTLPQVQEMRGTSDTKFANVHALTRELVDRNWLTPYQANQLLLGHGNDLLVGSYRLLARLGKGGMGQVFKAYHVTMDRIIALKVIPKERMSDPNAVARFSREVRAVAKLSHPNIVTAFEVNQIGQTPFLAMEYMEGIDLAKLVTSNPVRCRPRELATTSDRWPPACSTPTRKDWFTATSNRATSLWLNPVLTNRRSSRFWISAWHALKARVRHHALDPPGQCSRDGELHCPRTGAKRADGRHSSRHLQPWLHAFSIF